MYYAGLIDFIRNEPKTLPTAIFGPQNMIAGTFNTQYIFPETDSPDHVVVKYVDENTWSESQVKCVLPGRSEEHTSELQSLMRNSYAVFCLKKKKKNKAEIRK